MQIKTLEITTASVTYLVLELPAYARNVEIDAGFPKDGVIYTDDHLLFSDDSLFTHHFKLPSNGWQLIGFGKDHPKLVEELGLLQENSYLKPAFNPSFIGHSPSNDYSYKVLHDTWQQAESKVFKNPIILKKNDPN